MPLSYSVRRSLYGDSLVRFLRSQAEPYLLTEMPGNIGDHLIWAGTRDLLVAGGVSCRPLATYEVGRLHYPHSTLLIPGSGAFSRLWHEWLPDTVLAAARRFRRVVILPSSYDVSVPIVAQCLSQPNVYAFARETASYRSVRSLGRAALSFDCAVQSHVFDQRAFASRQRVQGSGLLLALREDGGSLLPGLGLLPNRATNQDISLTSATLEDWLGAIAQSGTVVTDRLHVAVAAVLLGKRLLHLDPHSDKISTYFKYTFRDTFDDLTTQCSAEWLLAHDLVRRSETP